MRETIYYLQFCKLIKKKNTIKAVIIYQLRFINELQLKQDMLYYV